MQVEVVQHGRVLRTVSHQGQVYVEAPPEGTYSIRVRNTTHRRRLAVISVDGVNVVNGEDAGFNGPGYVINPWQTVDIPGWRRTDGTVAAFQFKESEDSYAAQTGRGTNNVGVIGVAAYDEKVKPVVARPPIVIKEVHHHHHHDDWCRGMTLGGATFGTPDYSRGSSNTGDGLPDLGTTTCSVENSASGSLSMDSANFESDTRGATKSAGPMVRTRRVGTGYGAEQAFHTTTTEFERSTESPVLVLSLRYGTRDQLVSWGVPLDAPAAVVPNAFPVSQPSVPAPPGWRG